jgi:DNA-binding FadR family transcriptional regulator
LCDVPEPEAVGSVPSSGGTLDLTANRRAIDSARGEKISLVVARMIARHIAEEKLAPGSPLATEQQMASAFGVGRPSVREALRLLESQGIVVIRQGQGGGPVVATPTGAEFGRTMSLFLQVQHVTFRDALEASVQLGGVLAGLAAANVAAGDDELLPQLLAASEVDLSQARDDRQFLVSGSDFHAVVAAMAGNATLALVSGGVGYLYTTRTSASHKGHWDASERDRIRSEHLKIAAAIRRGSVNKARQLNEEHLRGEIDYIDKVDPGRLDEVLEWS